MNSHAVTDNLRILSYWKPRGESSLEAGHSLAAAMVAMGSVCPDLASWYEVPMSWKQARSRPIVPSGDLIARKFHFDDPILTESLHGVIINGSTPGSSEMMASLRFQMGSGHLTVAKPFPNNLLLEMKEVQRGCLAADWPSSAESLVQAIVKAVRPDHLIATDLRVLMEYPKPRREGPLGWITYIRLPDAAPRSNPIFPSPATAQFLSKNELLVKIERSIDDVAVAELVAIREVLVDCGWLVPQPMPNELGIGDGHASLA